MKVIFDLDGTLFQTLPCARQGVRAIFEKLGLPIPEDSVIREGIGMPSNQFMKMILPQGVDADEMLAIYRSAEREDVREHGRLYPGMKELLQELKLEGHNLVLCSNGSKEYIDLVLTVSGVISYFDQLISARDFPSKADGLKAYLDNENDAVMIGDTISDVIAARKSRIPVIIVKYGFGDTETYAEADYAVPNTEELKGMIHRVALFSLIAKQVEKKQMEEECSEEKHLKEKN